MREKRGDFPGRNEGKLVGTTEQQTNWRNHLRFRGETTSTSWYRRRMDSCVLFTTTSSLIANNTEPERGEYKALGKKGDGELTKKWKICRSKDYRQTARGGRSLWCPG